MIYHLKRATVEVQEMGDSNNVTEDSRVYVKRIEQYKIKLSKITDRNNAEFRLLKAEVSSLKKKIRRLVKKSYEIKIHLKKEQYNKTFSMEVELDTPSNMFKLTAVIKECINSTVREFRLVRKSKKTPKVVKHEVVLEIESSKPVIYSEPGQILKMHIKKNVKKLYIPKKPEQTNRYIGLELEFCAPINEQEFAIKLFQNGFDKFVELKQDGSLRPKTKETGFELAVLMKESEYKKQLKALTKLLNDVGAKTEDRRCGLHVHIDMRNRNKHLVYNNLVACQNVLMSMVDPSRIDNEFCRTVDSRKFPTSFNADRQERYKTINASAYYKYKTLEIRMHEGSIDCMQIVNWIDLLIKISNYKKKMKYDVYNLTELKRRIKIDKRTFSKLIDRSCFLQVNRGSQNRIRPIEAYDLQSVGFTVPQVEPSSSISNGAAFLAQQGLNGVGGTLTLRPSTVVSDGFASRSGSVWDPGPITFNLPEESTQTDEE